MTDFITAVIPAAGKGARLGLEGPKQFAWLMDLPMLAWSVRALAATENVKQIIVGAPPDMTDKTCKIIDAMAPVGICEVTPGGERRQDTVRICLEKADRKAGIVLIHDAARPFIRPALAKKVADAAEKHKAATLAVRPADSVKFEHATIGIRENLDRERLWQIQTPQAFTRELILEAHDRALKDGFQATDDTSLVERTGAKVEIVRGSVFNLKITGPDDLEVAQALVETGRLKPEPIIKR